jgi:putative ABC transport system permease protein
MIIRLKDAAKLIGVSIIACCAVFVCTLFLNYNIDIAKIKGLITSDTTMALYNAKVLMGKVTSSVSGGCLLLTSVVMLFFYIKHYIDVHKKELGIMKALGYSNLKIAKGFWVFGFGIFIGTTLGFCSSYALMPTFYKVMNEDSMLPEMPLHFNAVLALYLIVLPTATFALLAVAYSYRKLKCPALELLRGKSDTVYKKKHHKKQYKKQQNLETTFLQELKRSTVKSRSSLVFFIAFASFCYADMMQMSFSMDKFASTMFTIILVSIGLILSCTTLFLAITTVVNENTKTIAMMKIFGYSLHECSAVILNGYRPIAYIGFAIGTIYQYGLMKSMLLVYSKTEENIPEYNFDVKAFIIVLISFALIYEFIMYCYSARIKKISIKEIMLK